MSDLIAYLSTLTVTQGRRAGQPFTVLPWQARFLRGAFADGIQSAGLSVGRGNGKTALLAGVACAALDGPLAVPRAETIIVAASFSQARIAFDHVIAFMGDKLADRKVWRIADTMQNATIEHRETGAKVKVVGSDPRRAHGLAPVLILADEPAQWPDSTGERMRAALQTAAGKQMACTFVALGTRPADEGHWFSKMLTGGADFAQVHAALPDDPPFQARTWAKANPSMRHLPDLHAAIRTEAKAAKADPGLAAQFAALRLNLGTADTERPLLIDSGLWRTIEGEAERSGPCVWGIDLGTSAAMSAVSCYWPETGRLETLAAFPVEPSLAERGIRDGVGGLYVDCARRGELLQNGGRAVDIAGLIVEAMERYGAPVRLAADRWREAELRDVLERARVPVAALETRGQGYKDGGEDVRCFRRACAENKVTPVVSLLMRSALAEARVMVDPAGSAKLAKNNEGGRRARARDDAAAAAILAVATGSRMAARPTPRRRRYGLAG